MTRSRQPDLIVDVTGETCPIPLVEMRKAVLKAGKGQIIEIRGTHAPSKKEIPMAVQSLGLKLMEINENEDGSWRIRIKK